MVYLCRDCSYQGNTGSADGYCPACGSASFRRRGAGDESEPEAKRKGSLVILGLLWGYLIAHVCWKLYQ